MPNRKRARDAGFYALILLIMLSTIFAMTKPAETAAKVVYSDVLDLFRGEKVESFTIDGENNLVMNLREEWEGSETVTYALSNFAIFYNDLGELILQQKQSGILSEYDYEPPWEAPWWLSFLPYLGVILIMGVLWYVMMSKSQGGGVGGVAKFSKARTRLGTEESKRVTFNDVAGADEEKEELQEVVDFLKNPGRYTEMGARIPKGVLLVGPPGTGKTLIAKAVAGEAGVQFLSISGSDFVELYVGVGASRVRDLFDQAKKVAPSIIFIDEIDAVGRQRGSGLGGGHDEREQTLNQLLVEMDGFGNNEGVIVIAATNRNDILDNALLRPGRFDRQVYVGLPDIRGREAILKVHSRGKSLGDDVDLGSIAKGTPGFTGADLENLLNEAALLAVRRRKRFITQPDIDEAILKVMAGPEKKSKVISEKEKRLTAFHEAGHAVVSRHLKNVDPVHHITIIPRGGAGGMTVYRPQEDKSYSSRSEMFERIIISMGGRVAEKLMLDDISTGASGDIQQASALARAMVTRYGMSDRLGPISFDSSGHSIFIGRDFGTTKSYSEETAAVIDAEVKRIFDEAMAKCEEILIQYKDTLMALAEYLLVHETMDGEEFAYFCDHGNTLPENWRELLARESGDNAGSDPAQIAEAPKAEEKSSEEASETAPGDDASGGAEQ